MIIELVVNMEMKTIKLLDIQNYRTNLIRNEHYNQVYKTYSSIDDVKHVLPEYEKSFNTILVVETESKIWGSTFRIFYKDRK